MVAIYDAATTLLFRLLFIAYFEDRNRDLLAAHPYWPAYGLHARLARLQDKVRTAAQGQPPLFDGFRDIKDLFATIDGGDADLDIPLFNGGLFDRGRAPLLNAPKVFDNVALLSILERLCYKSQADHNGQLHIQRGDFYVHNANHSRKASASYYTPESLTAIVVREGIAQAR